jgi:glycosyltransferase involved in cell wall biosynthesis
MQDKLVSIVLRSSSKMRFHLLDRALFSILGSYYKNIEVVLVVQTEDDIFFSDICNLTSKYKHFGLCINVFRNKTSKDARAKNLNIGINNAQGRYIKFLDDDDVIYPDHISSLIYVLNKSDDVAWAYSDVADTTYDLDVEGNPYLLSKGNKFKRNNFSYAELFVDNFIPIHSYILDRTRIDSDCLIFDESMTALEDYAFLLRFAFRYKPLYLPKTTCEYRFYLDGSNTILIGTTNSNSDEKANLWSEARDRVELIRKELIASQIFDEYNCHKEVLKTYRRHENNLAYNAKIRNVFSTIFPSFKTLKLKHPILWSKFVYFASKVGLIKQM